MPGPDFSASALIAAPPAHVYRIIADYRDEHPRILPRPPFVSLEVEEGGYGEGTVVCVQMRVLGRVQTFRAIVSEPEPGRVLVETTDTGYITSFIVDPADDGRSSRVTIATEIVERRGALPALERRFVPMFLRPVYERELENLAAAATRRAA